MRSLFCLFWVGFGLLAVVPAAHAQRGVATETFHPAIDSYGIFTVERADTGRQWDFGFRLFVDYANQPLRLPMKDANGVVPRGAGITIMNYEVVTHLGIHFSLFDWAEVALVAPVSAQGYSAAFGDPCAYSSDARTCTQTGFFASGPRTNVGAPDASPLDTELALKLRTPRFGPIGFALIAAVTIPFGDKSAFVGDSSFTFRPSGVVDVTVGKFTAAINFGYVLRRDTVVTDPADAVTMTSPAGTLIEVGGELSYSAGVAYRVLPALGLGVEAYGLLPLAVDQHPTDRTAATPDRVLDVLGGLQLFPGRDITLCIGAGAGVLDAHRHDAFRLFTGIAWAPTEGPRQGAFQGGRDSDGDGIPDSVDLCPNEPEDKDGFDDEDGCPDPDNDQDGIPDALDKCPNEPEDKDGFQDEDGCPDPDNDGDGIPDALDKCPNEPEDKDGFQDEDGCPDPDNDGDGIPDALDKCPNEPETFNGVDDEDGCPDTGGTIAIAGGKVELPDQIQFETGHARILPRSYSLLDRIAQKLKENPAVRHVRVEGHTDDQGTEKANQELSQARADTVVAYLVKRGVDAARLQSAGYGATRPIASNRNTAGRAKNRRVEFIIVEQ